MPEIITGEARLRIIHTAVSAANAALRSGQAESRTIKWKGNDLNLPVATIDLDYVLLNPYSHRIRGQLESLPAEIKGVVDSDPFGSDSQALIQEILVKTDGYEAIRNAIDRDGQLEPGVLTDAGVLINANTRVVALRELGQGYVKVIVLPADATTKEITDIELQLQMEVDVKQSYTLTSQLLFIEDLINSGRSTSEIGRSLRPDLTNSASDQRKAKEFVELELRLLSLIREVQSASDGQLTFVYFDDKRQALIEIDQDYQGMKSSKPEEAVRVRDAQLTALLSGIDYRKLREIDRQLLDEYFVPAIREDILLAPYVEDLLTAPASIVSDERLGGLDLLDDDDDVQVPGISLARLFNLIASTDEDGVISLSSRDAGSQVTRKALAAGVNGAIRMAIETKALDARAGDVLQAPRNLLREAARSIDKAKDAYSAVSTSSAFDRDAFDRAYEEYQRAAEDLEDVLSGGSANG